MSSCWVETKRRGRIGAAEGNNGQLIFRAEIGWDPISALPKNAGAPVSYPEDYS